MNDICESSKVLSFMLFADDTNLFLSDKNINNLYHTIKQELKAITSWLSANKLSLDVNKTHFMVFKTKKRKKINEMHKVLRTIYHGKTILIRCQLKYQKRQDIWLGQGISCLLKVYLLYIIQ